MTPEELFVTLKEPMDKDCDNCYHNDRSSCEDGVECWITIPELIEQGFDEEYIQRTCPAALHDRPSKWKQNDS